MWLATPLGIDQRAAVVASPWGRGLPSISRTSSASRSAVGGMIRAAPAYSASRVRAAGKQSVESSGQLAAMASSTTAGSPS